MDLEVKTEVTEEHPTTPTHHHRDFESSKADEEVTIAQLSSVPASKPKRKPKPKSIYSADEQMRTSKKKEKIILKIKKSQSENVINQAIPNSGGSSKSLKKNRAAVNGKCSQDEPKSPAMIRAEEVRSNLEPAFPSFAKLMVRSHVASCFWMGLPGQFCRTHLPQKDTTIVVEDESGKQYEAKYFSEKTGLSAGWRQFATAHNLVEGDVLVFQLIEPQKFKVYIIRANDFTELDGALGLLNLEAQMTPNDADPNLDEDNVEKIIPAPQSTKKKRKSLPLAVVQKRNKKSSQPRPTSILGQQTEQSGNDSEEVGSEVLEGYKLSQSSVQFNDIISFDDFNISVDGLVIDSELPDDIRAKYYKLCCSQNVFLHDSLIKGINLKLVVGIISETVNISEVIRTCKLSTSQDEFAMWDKTLKAFEVLGMNVGFLRARIHRLVSVAYESEASGEIRRYIEAKTQHALVEDEIRNIKARLVVLEGACERFDAEIESLKPGAENYEIKFLEEVTAPW